MGLLHRLIAHHAPEVWEMETRLLHGLGRARPPEAIQWIATKACDLKCPHCYSDAARREKGELSTDEAKRLVDELVKLGRPTFVLAGGEPFLRGDMTEIVEYASSRGVPWAVHSHGGTIARHRALLEKHPPRMAAISVDGPRAFHDEFRGREGSFDDAIEALRVLGECGCPEVVAGTTVTRRNADLLADLFPHIAASRADAWGLHLFVPEGRGLTHRELIPSVAQLRRVAAFARRKRHSISIELDNEWGSAGRDDVHYRDRRFLCGAGRISCVVAATGEILPCTTTDLSESEGNVRDVPLSRVWAEGFRAFRGGSGIAANGHECWLQARAGNSCREPAFGIEP